MSTKKVQRGLPGFSYGLLNLKKHITYDMFLQSLCGDFWKRKKKKKTLKYTKLIKEMYNKIIVYVGVITSGGITSEFPITIGLH